MQNKIKVELDEKDIREDIANIVSAMSKIRVETLANKKCDEKQNDEYLHLSYRLASAIQGLADEGLVKKLDDVTKSLDKDERLIWYDYLQDNYWKKNNSNFSRNLEKVVISVLGENLNSLETKHHVLQAIKFLGVTEEPFEEKERIYATIMPYNGKVKGIKKQNKFFSLIGSLFGYSYKIEEDGELGLRIKGNPNFLEDVVQEVSGLGYRTLQIDMFRQDFNKLKEKIPEMQVIENLEKSRKSAEKREKIKKAVQNLIRFTTPISYPLLGFLPESLQDRIMKYTDGNKNYRGSKGLGHFNERDATISSMWCEVIGGLGTGIGSWVYTGRAGNLGTFIGLCAILEAAIRGLVSTKGGDRPTKATGSFPVKIATFPLKKALDYKDNQKNERGSYCRVEVKLKNNLSEEKTDNEKNNKNNITNMFEYFSKIAQLPIPENIENNLIWSTENHHNYAKDFSACLDGEIKQIEEKPIVEMNVDRKNQIYNIFEDKEIGEYRKFTSLACLKGRRYVLSLIGEPQDYLTKVNEILSENTSPLEKAKQITKNLNVNYARLLCIENGKPLDERIIMG